MGPGFPFVGDSNSLVVLDSSCLRISEAVSSPMTVFEKEFAKDPIPRVLNEAMCCRSSREGVGIWV